MEGGKKGGNLDSKPTASKYAKAKQHNEESDDDDQSEESGEVSNSSSDESSGIQFSTRSSTPTTRSKKHLEKTKRKQEERQERKDQFLSIVEKMDRETQEVKRAVLHLTKAVNLINGYGDGNEEAQELELPLEPATKKQKTRTAREFQSTIGDVVVKTTTTSAAVAVPESASHSTNTGVSGAVVDATVPNMEGVNTHVEKHGDITLSEDKKHESDVVKEVSMTEVATTQADEEIKDASDMDEPQKQYVEPAALTEDERLALLTDYELEEEEKAAIAARNRALSNKIWDIIEERTKQKKNLL